MALCHGGLCRAGEAAVAAGWRLRWPHAAALPEWPSRPAARDHDGWQGRPAEEGRGDGVGGAAVSARQEADAVVPGTGWPGQGAAAEDRHGGAGAAVTDGPVALPADGSAASESGPQGCSVRRNRRAGEQVSRRAQAVVGWEGQLVARPGGAARTDSAEGGPPQRLQRRSERMEDRGRAPSAGTPDSRSFGARALHG